MRARRAGHHSDQDASARALAAMAEAARRSHDEEIGREARRTGVEGRSVPPPMQAQADASAPSPVGGSTTTARRARRLSRPILLLVGLVAVIVAVTVSSINRTEKSTSHSTSVTRAGPATTTVSPPSSPPTSPSTTAPPPASPSTTAPPPASSPAALPFSTTTIPPPPGGGPVLSALDPSSGAPGQVVVITGTNFISPSGQISVQFGGQVSLIACPESTSCLVAVPPATGGTTSASVTVTTDGGTSNPLTFTYG